MTKNIIICSDGTGNSGGKKQGTNVWRLFNAIKHNGSEQVSFYDDGVGSQDFIVFKILGGAFGWGLALNIRQIYSFLVKQYDPGDNIYFFGFSRGAHTVRLVADMVIECGILKRDVFEQEDEDIFNEAVYAVQRAYRKSFRHRSGLAERGTTTKNNDFEILNELAAKFKKIKWNAADLGVEDRLHRDISIHFIGVWDTVDALGVPIDEIREGLEIFARQAILDRTLNVKVLNGCQALSIDDERQTFHPVLWEIPKDKPANQKIEQVWFSGVHSNVGGGYAKDQLAHVSLHWMMTKASKVGLEINDELFEEYKQRADPHGRIYDSRRGPAAYYRYKPRDIEQLCQQSNVPIIVHSSVLDRIQEATGGYAPVTLPSEFEVAQTDSPSLEREPINLGEDAPKLRDIAWGLIWWRRVLYFLFVLFTVIMITHGRSMIPDDYSSCDNDPCVSFTLEKISDKKITRDDSSSYGNENPCVSYLLDLIPDIGPDFTTSWLVAGYRCNPGWLLVYSVLFIALLWFRTKLKALNLRIGNAYWYNLFPKRRPQAKNGDKILKQRLVATLVVIAKRYKKSYLNKKFLPWFNRKLLPILVLVCILGGGLMVIVKICKKTVACFL